MYCSGAAGGGATPDGGTGGGRCVLARASMAAVAVDPIHLSVTYCIDPPTPHTLTEQLHVTAPRHSSTSSPVASKASGDAGHADRKQQQ